MSSWLFFFFFQAEDGIRDKLVTGVQTCALPICQPLAPQPRRRAVEQGVADRWVVDGFEEAVEADPVAVLPRVRVVLDRGNPSDDPAIGPREEILGDGVLKERVAGGGEQRPHIRAQLRDPARVAPVQVVGKGDEALETAPVGDGHDLYCAQMTPSSLPSRAQTSSAWSICCDLWVAIRLVRSRHWDGGTAGGTTGS